MREEALTEHQYEEITFESLTLHTFPNIIYFNMR